MWRVSEALQHAQYDGAATELVTYPVYGTSQKCTMCNGWECRRVLACVVDCSVLMPHEPIRTVVVIWK